MNTMSYFLISLQTTAICTTHASNNIKRKHISRSDKIEQSVTNTKKIDELYKNFENITQTNAKLEELYNGIVDAFVEKYIVYENSLNHFHYKINHLSDYEPKKIIDFCLFNKDKLMKEVGLKENDIDLAFDCAFNTFVEISTFIMDTSKTMYELRRSYRLDIDAFYNDLHRNTELFEKHILSVNWLTKFKNGALDFTLLHNVTKIYVEYYDNPPLCFTYEFHNDINCLAKHKNYNKQNYLNEKMTTLLEHYSEKKILSNSEIFKNEYFDKHINYQKRLEDWNQETYNYEVEFASSAILIERGKATKIEYIAKTGYYADRKQLTYMPKINEPQMNFLAHIEKVYEFNKHCKMEFDALSIHPRRRRLDYLVLSKELNYKIKYLKKFPKQYANVVIDSIKEKHKGVMIMNFEAMKYNGQNYKAEIEFEKMMNDSVNILDAILNNNEDHKKMKTDTINDQYCNFDFIKYYNNEFEPIMNSVSDFIHDISCSDISIDKLKEDTLNLFNKINGLDFNENIKEIIELQDKIDKNIKNKIQYELRYQEYIHKHKRHYNRYYFNRDLYVFLQLQRKEKAQTSNPWDLDQLCKSELIKNLTKYFKVYEQFIANIFTNTIELKHKIIETEQKAFELMKIIQAYNKNDDE
ncbi:hypothetical protein BDAP_001904 [Binucleata daphniae]